MAEEGGGGGGIDADADEVTGFVVAGGEYDNLVLRCAAEKFFGISFRASLYKHGELLADIGSVRTQRQFVLKRDHPVEAFDLGLLRDVVGKML